MVIPQHGGVHQVMFKSVEDNPRRTIVLKQEEGAWVALAQEGKFILSALVL